MTVALSGELFAGVGGLGMAVDEVFSTRPAWFCEFDAAPSKVLAYRYPLVPNYGDVTKVDFTQVPHTTVRAGGFPCQDVSLAGRRRGMQDGTRSGLWSEFARSIEEDRPDWVVIENVRGLLSADASGFMEPCPLCVGDDPEHVLRALGAVLGDLADLGFDAEWTGIRASDVGATHGRFRVFILAWPSERTLADTAGSGRDGRARHEVRNAVERAVAAGGSGESRDEVTLLPTPTAAIQTKSTRAMMASRDNGRRSGGGQSSPLGLEEAASLVARERPEHLPGDAELPPASLAVVRALLPTPGAYDGERGGSQHPDKRRGGGHSVTLQDVAEHSLMPTPRASRGGSATETMYALGAERVDDERTQGQVVGDITDWGPYTAAIRRWEVVTGRPAPSPVRHDGKGGKARLNPELTEWMMGWPAGWVTDPAIGLSRAEQLKACGNGVVPQQAAAALRELLARPGVPSVRAAMSGVESEYAKSPALAPFSRTPMSFELAATLGTRSHAEAQRRAETPIPEFCSEGEDQHG